jgi:hypothetical protein
MNILKKITPLILMALVLMLNSCATEGERRTANTGKGIDQPFAHHVFFWLNDPQNADDRATFEEGLRQLLEIPEIKQAHIGFPANVGQRSVVDGSYTYSYLVMFDNIEGHNIYQDHPIHLKFIDDYKHLWSRVVVYDSEAIQK